MASNEETSSTARGLGSPQPYEIGMNSLPCSTRLSIPKSSLRVLSKSSMRCSQTFLFSSQPVLRVMRITQPVYGVHSAPFPSHKATHLGLFAEHHIECRCVPDRFGYGGLMDVVELHSIAVPPPRRASALICCISKFSSQVPVQQC